MDYPLHRWPDLDRPIGKRLEATFDQWESSIPTPAWKMHVVHHRCCRDLWLPPKLNSINIFFVFMAQMFNYQPFTDLGFMLTKEMVWEVFRFFEFFNILKSSTMENRIKQRQI